MEFDAKAMRQMLISHYGENIATRIGNSGLYAFDLTVRKKTNSLFAAYIHTKNKNIVIWNLQARIRNHGTSHVLSLAQKQIDQINCENDKIYFFDRKYDSDFGRRNEKVFVFTQYALIENIDHLWNLVDLENIERDVATDDGNLERGRHAATYWNRNCEFRSRVLSAYSNQCAICRCSEKAILEAAHIIPIANKGSDETINGICLCRNHHRMLDVGLIEINHRSRTLSFVSETVKNMAWYKQFCEDFQGELIQPTIISRP